MRIRRKNTLIYDSDDLGNRTMEIETHQLERLMPVLIVRDGILGEIL